MKVVIGDRYAFGTFELVHGFCWLDTDDTLADLLGRIPDHACETEVYAVVEVVGGKWREINAGESEPIELRTLYEVRCDNLPGEDT